MTTTILFENDRAERLADEGFDRRLGRSSLLWVDVGSGDDEETLRRIRDHFGLSAESTERLSTIGGAAFFQGYGDYIHLTFSVPAAPERETPTTMIEVECLLGERWVLTAHTEPVSVIDDFAERAEGSGQTGLLDGPAFVAAIFDWVLNAYESAFEAIEAQLERFDVEAMEGGHEQPQERIATLIGLRGEIGTLRRALVAHRHPLVALSHPELERLTSKESAERYRELLARFESTLASARDAREAVMGSFDVLIASSGHRTNELMKVFTLATVILLPGTLVAALMGMNFKEPLFEHPNGFWVVVAATVAFAAITVSAAKRRRWI